MNTAEGFKSEPCNLTYVIFFSASVFYPKSCGVRATCCKETLTPCETFQFGASAASKASILSLESCHRCTPNNLLQVFQPLLLFVKLLTFRKSITAFLSTAYVQIQRPWPKMSRKKCFDPHLSSFKSFNQLSSYST